MLVPMFMNDDPLFDLFPFADFRRIGKELYGRKAGREMKTDVREKDDHYEVDIDLPGFKKEDIELTLENGYLTVSANKVVEKNIEGKSVIKERYEGGMSRSFCVGDAVTEADITAKLENGVLSLTVPKKDQKALPEAKRIAIEG